MALGLSEYIHSLDQRSDLIWPKPSPPQPLKVTPYVKPLSGIRAVTYSVYGTLLQIDQGELLHLHSQEIRLQIALEKTIKEFNMWNSMSRKPGQPWEYMLRQYTGVVKELRMAGSKRKGDYPQLDSAKIWRKLIDRLIKNEYTWDQGQYGDVEHLAMKVAYFFHANLQGTAAAPGVHETLSRLTQTGVRQGLLADGQCFTVPQLIRNINQQGVVGAINEVIAPELVTISSQVGMRKPSVTLYETALGELKSQSLTPSQVLHVSHRLKDDLAMAKKLGFRTALFAADKNACQLEGVDIRNDAWKPDRLISQISQIQEILSI